jgi:hypothetical protein
MMDQMVLDPQAENLWALQAAIDLKRPDAVDGLLVRLSRSGA